MSMPVSHRSPPVNGFLADEDPKSVLDLVENLLASRKGGNDVDEPASLIRVALAKS